MRFNDSAWRAAIPAVVAIVFALARRYLPAAKAPSVTIDEAKRFSRLNWRVGTAIVLIGICVGFSSYELLSWGNRFLASLDPAPVFILLPERAMFGIFPSFGAICVSWELTLRLWSLFGDPLHARKFELWSNEKAGFNATRVLRLMSIGIALPIGLLTMLAVPIHTTFDATGLTIGHFARPIPKRHAYSEIRAITVTQGLRIRDGRLQRRPAIVVDFSDGGRWSSADNRDPQKSIDQDLLAFLQEKTGLSVKYIEAFPFGKA